MGRTRRFRLYRGGFTLTELIVVIALISVLLGILLPALGGVWSTGAMGKSMNNLRQIAIWTQDYSSSYNDYIVPSRFNYSNDPYLGRVKVRSSQHPTVGNTYSGTWADILHAEFQVGVYPQAGASDLQNDFKYDAPDQALYDELGDGAIRNPFRSAKANTMNAPTGIAPKPYDKGAQEKGYPGFFAGNDFFDAGFAQDAGGENYTNGQIRYAARSLHFVDSFYGEIIADEPQPFSAADDNADGVPDTLEVDFRYGGRDGSCLILFMDGHIRPEGRWESLDDLRARGVRVQSLTSRAAE